MNYKSLYDKIILNAKGRLENVEIYYEQHHIIPRSMGGSDLPNNLVKLTAKEHFIAHHLLWKIYRNREMTHAFMLMCSTKRGGEKFYINSRQYDELKQDNRKFRSEFMKGRPGNNLGKTLSQEWKDNISKSHKGHTRGNGGSQGFKGKKHTEENKKLMSERRKGVATRTGIPFTEESKKKMSENRKGKPKAKWSDERKAARSEMIRQKYAKDTQEKSPN